MSLLSLFFSYRGRISGRTFRLAVAILIASFVLLFLLIQGTIGRPATLVLYPPFFWGMTALAAKRYHDRGKSALWMLVVVVPLLGIIWASLELLFARGTGGENRYGHDPLAVSLPDYQTVPGAAGGL